MVQCIQELISITARNLTRVVCFSKIEQPEIHNPIDLQYFQIIPVFIAPVVCHPISIQCHWVYKWQELKVCFLYKQNACCSMPTQPSADLPLPKDSISFSFNTTLLHLSLQPFSIHSAGQEPSVVQGCVTNFHSSQREGKHQSIVKRHLLVKQIGTTFTQAIPLLHAHLSTLHKQRCSAFITFLGGFVPTFLLHMMLSPCTPNGPRAPVSSHRNWETQAQWWWDLSWFQSSPSLPKTAAILNKSGLTISLLIKQVKKRPNYPRESSCKIFNKIAKVLKTETWHFTK